MATELRAYSVQVPAGTPLLAPVTIDVSFAPMITDSVEWHQPRGAQGLMGWRLTSGGAAVIPKNQGAYIITDGQSGAWQLEELHDSGKWEVTAYNTGVNPHVVNIRFHVRPITAQAPAGYPLAWLTGTPRADAIAEIGTLASAPELVSVPRAALWPPGRR